MVISFSYLINNKTALESLKQLQIHRKLNILQKIETRLEYTTKTSDNKEPYRIFKLHMQQSNAHMYGKNS